MRNQHIYDKQSVSKECTKSSVLKLLFGLVVFLLGIISVVFVLEHQGTSSSETHQTDRTPGNLSSQRAQSTEPRPQWKAYLEIVIPNKHQHDDDDYALQIYYQLSDNGPQAISLPADSTVEDAKQQIFMQTGSLISTITFAGAVLREDDQQLADAGVGSESTIECVADNSWIVIKIGIGEESCLTVPRCLGTISHNDTVKFKLTDCSHDEDEVKWMYSEFSEFSDNLYQIKQIDGRYFKIELKHNVGFPNISDWCTWLTDPNKIHNVFLYRTENERNLLYHQYSYHPISLISNGQELLLKEFRI